MYAHPGGLRNRQADAGATPLDVLVERDPPAMQVGLVALQAVWAAVMLRAAVLVQRRAERRLVIQGG